MSVSKQGAWMALLLRLFLCTTLLSRCARAVFIPFQNCLPDYILYSQPEKQLQFTPLFVDAVYGGKEHEYPLSLTIYGNVSGQQFTGPYPPANSSQWSDPENTFGKIANVGTNNSYSALEEFYQVLTYTPLHMNSEFCKSLVNGSTCPLGPAFKANASDPYDLPAFEVSHPFNSSYAFSSIVPTIKIISGDDGAKIIACISATITPDLGSSIASLLTWLPAGILIIKGLATISAAIWSPWGSTDIFRWSSNYGRDEDLLRLVTPGFGDCLQYIQFVVLTGSLTLQYPGFYQPAVSQASWSLLLFNESFVSHGNGTRSLVDGIYNANATYGLTRMSQLVGMTRSFDIWACMAIWLLVIAGAVVVLCQLGFIGRALYRSATHTSEEDLRRKNLPFTLGHMNRLLFNFFILPIVSISLFQLVISPHSPTSVIVCAVILLAIMIISAGWILRIIFVTKPRTILFDDMPTVLLYGPLYNTYSDSQAPFALIPVFITFIRGVAIGAVQPSGIAQVIILAICEVILILTLNGFRPFQGQTSMNLYHTFFAAVRLVTILLMIAFVPSLGVTEAPKGWIAYVILLLHACVLVFGFFLNAAQTLVEVIARACGAGDDSRSGVIRGSILSWRMLKKRQTRPDADRHSMMSSAAMLRGEDAANFGGRSRSMSASSNQLLNRHSGLENFSNPEESQDPEFDAAGSAAGAGSYGGKPSIGSRNDAGEFYRAPRPRKGTFDNMSHPGNKTRKSGAGDFPYQDSPGQASTHARGESYESAGHGSPAPAFLRERHSSNDSTSHQRIDYAVREVDQYYRGPALSDLPTRKLKTGPADPEGPASTAQTWFQRLMFGLQGKKKDQSKGFEVVRSARMPPDVEEGVEMQTSPQMKQEPYGDGPNLSRGLNMDSPPQSRALGSPETDGEEDGFVRVTSSSNFDFGFDGAKSSTAAAAGIVAAESSGSTAKPRPDSETVSHPNLLGGGGPSSPPIPSSSEIPVLPPTDTGETFRFPSRFNSRASGVAPGGSGTGNTPPETNELSRSPETQDWLRAVDELSWRDLPSSTGAGAGTSAPVTNAASGSGVNNGLVIVTDDIDNNEEFIPRIPRRSSRRGSSLGPNPSSPTTPTVNTANRNSAAFLDPDAAGIGGGGASSNSSGDLLGRTRSEEEEEARPTSLTSDTVRTHRAADSITRNSLGASAALNEGRAEFFGDHQTK